MKLEEMLADMSDKLVTGGKMMEQAEHEKQRQQREYQEKLEEQRAKAKELEQQKKEQDDLLLNAEKQYKDVQEELQASRHIIKKLKLKYQSALAEIKDLEQENAGEKEELLVQVQQQDVDLKFYRKLVHMTMKNEEIAKLKMKSTFEDDINDWVVPPFLLKAREVALPSLSIKK